MLLVSELEAFKKGEYRYGSGANNIQGNKYRPTTTIDAAKYFTDEIRKFPSSIVIPENGYKPPKKLSGEENNYLKVVFRKQKKIKRK